MNDRERQLLDRLRALHAEVDREAQNITARLGDRLRCGPGCTECCQDDLTVFDVEALRIRAEFPEVLAAMPAPVGRCAFLDADNRCRIYPARPYVCRTQGLPLRWLDELDGRTVEYRDICPLNDEGPPLETLPSTDCFTLGPVEEKLRQLQTELSGALDRTPLRALFPVRN